MEQKKSIREASADARLLYKRLSEMNSGDFVSYAELSAIIGRDIQHEGRGYLNTARLMCEREDSKTFGIITNQGLRCLNNGEVINTAAHAVTRIKRASRKSIRRLQCVNDISALSNDEKIRLNTYASILGVMATMAKGSSIKKIEARVQETQEQLPYIKTLEAFR